VTTPTLPRRLNLFDATMIVMGGIVGSGIFINPYVVALHVHTPFLILGVWILGGVLALLGAFIWAELATRMPSAGGQYLYLREAYHRSVAFLYGWVLLLVTQTGGMAAVAVTFAKYFREISGSSVGDGPIAAAALLGLTAINCLGARAGSNVQSLLMLLKAAAIIAMVALGLWLGGGAIHPLPLLDRPISFGLAGAVGAAMIPIAFAYGGWQTATFVAGEMRDPSRELSRGLIAGVLGVVALYLSVNFVCLRVLCPAGLAATHTPASAVMRAALGERGAQWIAVGIAISTLGFLSQGILTAPRVYYAMARDGLFFQSVGYLSPKTGAPVIAILIQGVAATIIALSGRYEQILNYVVSIDFISFALTAASLFVFRHREHSNQAVAAAFRGGRFSTSSPAANDTAPTIPEPTDNPSTTGSASSPRAALSNAKGIPNGSSRNAAIYRVPGHPYTTAIFVLSCAAIVASTIWTYPANSIFGFVILAAGIPVYLYWSRKAPRAPEAPK
jgi:basic amino acid/polyamine antiporter, APA family